MKMALISIACLATLTSFGLVSDVLAWSCDQSCPSSVFSGKLECEAHKRLCRAKDSMPSLPSRPAENNYYIKNNCDDVILVTVEYVPMGSTDFWKKNNFTFSPYEKGLVLTTSNRYVYVSAKSHPSYSKKNYQWGRKQTDIGSKQADFTYSLSCK